MDQPLRLIVRPSLADTGERKSDLFDAYLDGEFVVRSKQPLFDGARELKRRGYADDATPRSGL